MPSADGIVVPPLPEWASSSLFYTTRNDAFSSPMTLTLTGQNVACSTGAKELFHSLRTARSIRLEFAPTRVEPNRFRCRLEFRSGRTIIFYNRSYVSFATFTDSSGAYRVFVMGLTEALAQRSPACRFLAGTHPANYGAGVVGMVVAIGAVIVVAAFLLISGLWWLLLVKAVLIVIYLPLAWRWLRRNRQRSFEAVAIPDAVLPKPGEGRRADGG
ncbi:hypothetical protein [Synoicihabitans lomoniglobus]|uniref:hypothetical protein n=1 Tax=Synoicihabitans lomoniglobus TaxID=2909285 RepID=UPI002ED08C5E|nr:hypothetical protein [Opitutaceae bacterium LMO-M01]